MQRSQWREEWAGRVCTPEEFVRFVDEVGCCTSKPLPGFPQFPNEAEVLGSIPAGVEDPWFWKDDLHVQKRLYYTWVFGGQPGFLSNAMLPVLIATNGAVFDELVYDGLVSPEVRQIHDLIESEGPIGIKDLKKMLGPDAKRACDRVLHFLDSRFIITKTGITGRTRGTYGYIWDMVERWVPDALAEADRIGCKRGAQMLREHLRAFAIEPGSGFYQRVLGWRNGE
jgi:hypothetical protein